MIRLICFNVSGHCAFCSRKVDKGSLTCALISGRAVHKKTRQALTSLQKCWLGKWKNGPSLRYDQESSLGQWICKLCWAIVNICTIFRSPLTGSLWSHYSVDSTTPSYSDTAFFSLRPRKQDLAKLAMDTVQESSFGGSAHRKKEKKKACTIKTFPAIISRMYSASVARSQYERLTISTHSLFQQQQNRKTPHLANTVFKADYSPNFSLSPIWLPGFVIHG